MAVAKKVCMLGDFGVGKTSLVRRYVHGEFSPDYQTTLGVNIYKYSDEVTGPTGPPGPWPDAVAVFCTAVSDSTTTS